MGGSGESFPPNHGTFHHADAAKTASQTIRHFRGEAVLGTPGDPRLRICTRRAFEPIEDFRPKGCGRAE